MVSGDARQSDDRGRSWRTWLWLAAFLCGGLAGSPALGAADAMSSASEAVRAPALSLRDADGRPVSLRDFHGRVVLVEFWASWCRSCRALFPELDALHRQYRSRGVEVVAVNVDARQRDAMAFLRTRRHAMRILFDARGEALEALGGAGVPGVYLIDREGRVRYAHAGATVEQLPEYRRLIETLLTEP